MKMFVCPFAFVILNCRPAVEIAKICSGTYGNMENLTGGAGFFVVASPFFKKTFHTNLCLVIPQL